MNDKTAADAAISKINAITSNLTTLYYLQKINKAMHFNNVNGKISEMILLRRQI